LIILSHFVLNIDLFRRIFLIVIHGSTGDWYLSHSKKEAFFDIVAQNS